MLPLSLAYQGLPLVAVDSSILVLQTALIIVNLTAMSHLRQNHLSLTTKFSLLCLMNWRRLKGRALECIWTAFMSFIIIIISERLEHETSWEEGTLLLVELHAHWQQLLWVRASLCWSFQKSHWNKSMARVPYLCSIEMQMIG
jgi:hypothetical protein